MKIPESMISLSVAYEKLSDSDQSVLDMFRRDQTDAFMCMFLHARKGNKLIGTSEDAKLFSKHVLGCYPTLCIKAYESLETEVKSVLSSSSTHLKAAYRRLEQFEDDLENLDKSYKFYFSKRYRLCKKISKIKSKISRLKSGKSGICFGKRSELQNYTKALNEKDAIKATEHLTNYRASRLRPYYMMGEASERGNRKFDLRKCDSDHVLRWKPKNGVFIDFKLKLKSNKNGGGYQRKLIARLKNAIDNNLIPIGIKIDDSKIVLTFDVLKLDKLQFDDKAYKAQRKSLSASGEVTAEQYKSLKSAFFREQERNFTEHHGTNINRVFSVDLNPHNLGFAIVEPAKDGKSERVILAWSKSYNFRRMTANQKNHLLSIYWAHAFRIANHYRCGVFAMEDLNFDNKSAEANSTQFNRLTKNLWNRTLQLQLINKHCARYGLLIDEINPAYSSFVGNLTYDFHDPAAASAEIGRRSLIKRKVIEGTWYPSVGKLVNSKRVMELTEADGALRSRVEAVKSIVELYRIIREAKLRYRRDVDPTDQSSTSKSLKCKTAVYRPLSAFVNI